MKVVTARKAALAGLRRDDRRWMCFTVQITPLDRRYVRRPAASASYWRGFYASGGLRKDRSSRQLKAFIMGANDRADEIEARDLEYYQYLL